MEQSLAELAVRLGPAAFVRAACVHESGHAVVAHELDQSPTYVVVRGNGVGGYVSGECNPGYDTDTPIDDRATVAVAGVRACLILPDIDDALAMAGFEGPLEGGRSDSERFEEFTSGDSVRQQRCCSRAEQILRHRWDRVMALSEELNRHALVRGDRLQELLAGED